MSELPEHDDADDDEAVVDDGQHDDADQRHALQNKQRSV